MNSNPTNWQNYHNGVLNATDNAAYNARANTTIAATVFAIGLGGNSTTGPPDPVLLQRMANDPNGDEFNTTGTVAGAMADIIWHAPRKPAAPPGPPSRRNVHLRSQHHLSRGRFLPNFFGGFTPF